MSTKQNGQLEKQLLLVSCANLVSFKIVVLSIQIKTKSTTIFKEMRFAQLASKNERTLVDYILLETKLCSRNIRLQLVRS